MTARRAHSRGLDRRRLLSSGAGLLAVLAVRPVQAATDGRARVTEQAIERFTGGAAVAPGRLTFDAPPLVENGNAVSVSVSVDGASTAQDFVRRIALFNEKNPQPNVITATLGPRSGRRLSTRIRLADSQRLTAIAEMSDGSFHSATADVIVTLAACIEG
jgi:sulfur-oxidizing protein SoxY